MLTLLLALPSVPAGLHTIQYTVEFGHINSSMALVEASAGLTAECEVEMAVLRQAVASGATFSDHLSVASQILTLPGGGLLVYSPGNVTEQAAQLKRLGTPAVVVVPSLFHDGFAPMMQAAYPKAVFVAPHAITTKFPSLRVDIVLDAAKDNPGGEALALPAKLAALVGPNISFFQHVDQSRELVVHDASTRSLLTCDILYSNETTSTAPDPRTNPTPSIFSKAYTMPSIAAPYNAYRTWLATPPTYVLSYEAAARRGAPWLLPGSAVDVLRYNTMQLNLNEDPSEREVDPAKLLGFQSMLISKLAPLEHVATGHLGIVEVAQARRILRLQSSWLHRYVH